MFFIPKRLSVLWGKGVSGYKQELMVWKLIDEDSQSLKGSVSGIELFQPLFQDKCMYIYICKSV